jgi:hypothetical protein
MNDPQADPSRRDRAAIAAAPFFHRRPAAIGKKDQQAEAARVAEAGGSGGWGDDLRFRWEPN